MKRRNVVSLIGSTLVAGCNSFVPPDDDTVTRLPESEEPISVPIRSIEPNPGLRLDTTVESEFDADSPARLSVELENASDEAISYNSGLSVPLERLVGHNTTGNSAMFLYPEDFLDFSPDGSGSGVSDSDSEQTETPFVPTAPINGCWRATQDGWTEYATSFPVTIESGGSVSRSYVLLADPDNDGCLPASTYEFTQEVSVDDQALTLSLSIVIADQRSTRHSPRS